jgi:hypothetical protein
MGQTGDRAGTTVTEAADALVQREAAALRAIGYRVWLHRDPEEDFRQEGRHSFAYLLAADDYEYRLGLRYDGQPEDLVPAGFEDFTLFVDGGKADCLPSELMAAATSPAPPEVRPGPPAMAPDGTELRFVTRIDSAQAASEWLSRPDAYVRCGECGWLPDTGVVRVGDQEQECDCGEFARGEDGRLEWSEPHRFPSRVPDRLASHASRNRPRSSTTGRNRSR